MSVSLGQDLNLTPNFLLPLQLKYIFNKIKSKILSMIIGTKGSYLSKAVSDRGQGILSSSKGIYLVWTRGERDRGDRIRRGPFFEMITVIGIYGLIVVVIL